jgi:hypothetical protein
MKTFSLEIIIDEPTLRLLEAYAAELVQQVDDGQIPGIDELEADLESLAGALVMTKLQEWQAEQPEPVRKAVAA